MGKKLTQAEFIAKAVAVHGAGRYDYSQTVYVRQDCKVIICCPEHGIFEQTPNGHLSKGGCYKCGRTQASKKNTIEISKFIERAHVIHGSKYDYSRAVYQGVMNKIAIVCPEHGVFYKTPRAHTVKKQGCKQCSAIRLSYRFTSSTNQFTAKARNTHGSKYDYSYVVYKRAHFKVTVICPFHGKFEQVATIHLSGSGCPMCGRDIATEAAKLGWINQANGRVATLYFIRLFDDKSTEQFYKIGITFFSPSVRFGSINKIGGYHYEILALHKSPNAAAVYEWEQSIIQTFSHLHYKPAKHFVGETECFSSADEILAIFPL